MKSIVSSAALLLGCIIVSVNPGLAGRPQKQAQRKNASPSGERSSEAGRSACALLPISLLGKTFGQKFEEEPMETPMPPAYDGVPGTTCKFSPQPPFTKAHPTTVDLTIFTEASAAKAKETFDKVAAFLDDKSKLAPSGLGDEAYWQTSDSNEPQLHVLKGKSHYGLGVEPANDTQLVELARALSARL